MLKITVDGDYGTFEFEGSNFDMALEGGVLIYECVKNLRRSGRSDEFIRGMLEIVMEQEMHE